MRKLLLIIISLAFLSRAMASELGYPIGETDCAHAVESLNIEIDYLQSWWWPWSTTNENRVTASPFEIDRVLKLEDSLSAKILGQPHAVKLTVNSILSYAAGIQDRNRPVATLLYIGPTGVGKTELAKELTKQIYQNESRLIRFNMSELTHSEASVWRLIGPPQGYRDAEAGGQLSNPLLKNPYSIVLLDEFEKGHHEVRTFFLNIFAEGWFMSGKGEKVDCSNCIFIATSNLGASKILGLQALGLKSDQILTELEEDLMEALTPELYNRVEPVVFMGLSQDLIKNIIPLKLKELSQRIWNQKTISITFDETLVHYLQQHGYNLQLGARPLQRLIKKEIESAIAKAILQDHYQPGESMHISYLDECLVVTKLKRLQGPLTTKRKMIEELIEGESISSQFTLEDLTFLQVKNK